MTQVLKTDTSKADAIEVIESDLSLDFLRVVEQAAIRCAHTMVANPRCR